MFPVMTAQQVFDQVVSHLRMQNKKCHNGDYCMYRFQDEDGRLLKCAVGVLITDQEYRPWMDGGTGAGGGSIEQVLANRMCPPFLRFRLFPHLELIKRLQSIHDSNRPWEKDWKTLAICSGLHYTSPTEKMMPSVD